MMKAKTVNGKLYLEGANIGFRNFSGNKGIYNKEGERSFVIFLDEPIANELKDEGWNIRFPKPNENIDPEEDTRRPYLSVKVEFGEFPPKIVLIANGQNSWLDEESVNMLDTAEIQNVDIILNPYHWNVNGRSGIKAYLNTMYATIYTDDFVEKYGL